MKIITSLFYRLGLILALYLSAFYIISCEEEPDKPAGSNKIEFNSNTTAYGSTYFTATVSAEIIGLGGNDITDHGFTYGTSPSPDMNSSLIRLGSRTESGSFTGNLVDLNPNTTYFIRPFAVYSIGTVFGNETQITTLRAGKPKVSTSQPAEITLYSAKCGGAIESDSGYMVTASGICWDTDSDFTVDQCLGKTINQSGNNLYNLSLTQLTEGSTYYVKAFATNQLGTGYGETRQFTTTPMNVPLLSTKNVTSITPSTASSGGNITGLGNGTLLTSGICWDTHNQFNENECLGKIINSSGNMNFSLNITQLTEGTRYFIKAYATNEKGSGYGETLEFTTPLFALPTLTTKSVTNITSVSAVSGGNITFDGYSSVTSRGVCWSIHPNPTIDNSHTTDGNGTGDYNSNITGLTPGTTYYIRAYATNNKGTAYGSQMEFKTAAILPVVTTNSISNITINSAVSGGNVTSDGGASVTARGVCWSTTQNPTISNSFSSNGTGLGSFISNLSGLTSGTTYYVRAYATNSVGTAYGSQQSFTTQSSLPVVTTNTVINITSVSASFSGSVTSSGGSSVTARGFCYGTSPNPTLSNSHTTNGSGTGTFSANVSGFSPSTTYYVRAYATNSNGTAYGNQENFTTTWSCGYALAANHTAGSVAPVSKSISYGTTSTSLSGSNKCWITRNLGADIQAASATDASEASAGWYWQFNRKQGYKHDGSTRTPNTTWVFSINENNSWVLSNDPCALLIGSGWRIPTKTEWQNADDNGNWSNYSATFSSVLKIHAAGYLYVNDGSLFGRGTNGFYWSSSQYSSEDGWNLGFSSAFSIIGNNKKANGYPVRCIKD